MTFYGLSQGAWTYVANASYPSTAFGDPRFAREGDKAALSPLSRDDGDAAESSR